MKRTFCSFMLLLVLAASALAQQPPEDPIAKNLFPPDLIMNHQNEIGLSGSQRALILGEIQKTQTKFVELQWQLQDESEKLAGMLRLRPIDETRVLTQADRVMELEGKIKKTHLALLIRIKNSLSEEQQAKLAALRGKEDNILD